MCLILSKTPWVALVYPRPVLELQFEPTLEQVHGDSLRAKGLELRTLPDGSGHQVRHIVLYQVATRTVQYPSEYTLR